MKILNAVVYNFASYKELNLSFEDKGLTLIHGATGAGKSTLCDIIPWILFGRTAKNGSVDEVRSWNNKEETEGILHTDTITVYRTRGPNDLYFTDESCNIIRGKDLNDTQKLINQRLGIDAETYLSGAYFHEFSQAAQFFTLTAKNRRVILEQIVDLEMAKRLQDSLRKAMKVNQGLTNDHENEVTGLERHIKSLKGSYNEVVKLDLSFNESQDIKIDILTTKLQSFESDRQETLEALEKELTETNIKTDLICAELRQEELLLNTKKAKLKEDVCGECGAKKDNNSRIEVFNSESKLKILSNQLWHLNKATDNLVIQIEYVTSNKNTYAEQIEETKNTPNPYKGQIKSFKGDIEHNIKELALNTSQLKELALQIQDFDTLYDVLDTFRSELIKATISNIESNTNTLLDKYFDAEIRVVLTATDADKVEVEITKDGNIASYTQLSKGQRQLLKLCFGVSVMQAVSNYKGIKFNTIFIDEALDGLSEEFKIKAYSLLQELSVQYENVFVVEHSSELKNLFENKIEVTLVNGNSQIEEA